MSIDLRAPLSNVDLENILKYDVFCKNLFVGVFPIDKLPTRIIKRPAVLVFNFDKSSGPGTHWAALVLKNDSQMSILYFDSFGLCPLPRDLVTFLKNNGKRVCISRLKLQDDHSSVCGVYAALFILMYAVTKKVDAFFNLFSKTGTTRDNDNSVVCTLQNYLNTTGRRMRGRPGRLVLRRQYCQTQSTFRLTHRQPATRRHYKLLCTDLPLPLG